MPAILNRDSPFPPYCPHLVSSNTVHPNPSLETKGRVWKSLQFAVKETCLEKLNSLKQIYKDGCITETAKLVAALAGIIICGVIAFTGFNLMVWDCCFGDNRLDQKWYTYSINMNAAVFTFSVLTSLVQTIYKNFVSAYAQQQASRESNRTAHFQMKNNVWNSLAFAVKQTCVDGGQFVKKKLATILNNEDEIMGIALKVAAVVAAVSLTIGLPIYSMITTKQHMAYLSGLIGKLVEKTTITHYNGYTSTTTSDPFMYTKFDYNWTLAKNITGIAICCLPSLLLAGWAINSIRLSLKDNYRKAYGI